MWPFYVLSRFLKGVDAESRRSEPTKSPLPDKSIGATHATAPNAPRDAEENRREPQGLDESVAGVSTLGLSTFFDK